MFNSHDIVKIVLLRQKARNRKIRKFLEVGHNMDKVTSHCRLCAECKPYAKLVDVSYDEDKRSEITTKLTRLNSPVCDVFTNNDLPKTVCLVCINTLNNSYDFIQNIETAQKVLNIIYKEQPEINYENTSTEKIALQPLKLEPCKELHLVDSIEIGVEKVNNKKIVHVETVNRMTWKEYSWACVQCDTMFPTLDELQTHTIEIHGICNRYKCTECNRFKNRQNLDQLILHLGRHNSDLKYSCYKCHLQFDSPQMCFQHKLEHKHPELSCPGCNYMFNNIQELNEHKLKYYKGVSYKLILPNIPITDSLNCQICNVTCKTRYCLLRHISNCHSNSKNEFMCDTCGKCFGTQRNLMQHSFVHNDAKPFPCSDCEKSFGTKAALKIHRQLHTDVKRYKCKYCSKEFRWRNSLVQHIRLHTGEKPYTCEQCSRSFTNWPNYRKHTKRVHGISKLPKKMWLPTFGESQKRI